MPKKTNLKIQTNLKPKLMVISLKPPKTLLN